MAIAAQSFGQEDNFSVILVTRTAVLEGAAASANSLIVPESAFAITNDNMSFKSISSRDRMTALASATPLTSTPSILRPLSGFERLFLAFDKINGFNFGIAVGFRGVISDVRWKRAFDQVQNRNPLLNAGINEDDPHAPFFVSGAMFAIPLTFQRRISSTEWQRVMESDIAKPFDLASGPLLRAAVLQDEKNCDLVITANHVVIDGMGVLALVRDLLRALAGERLTVGSIPPSAEERAAEIRVVNPMPNWLGNSAEEPQPRNRNYTSRNRKGKSVISALRLSQEQSAQLLRFARREKTTIGAVLSAATASALRELSPQLNDADLRLTTAIDARPYLGNENDFVLSVISPRAIVPYPDQELPASARAIKTQIAPFQSFEAIATTFERVESVLAQELDAATIVNAMAHGFAHDVGVSNLRTVEFAPVNNDLAVESVWGPSVLVGYEGEHFVGVATFDGSLHLTYSSFTPFSGLLEAIRQTISNACGDA